MVSNLRAVHPIDKGRYVYKVLPTSLKGLFGRKVYEVRVMRQRGYVPVWVWMVTGLERAHKRGIRECRHLQRKLDEADAFEKSGLGA